MRTIVTKDGKRYYGQSDHFEDMGDHILHRELGTARVYRIYKTNIAEDTEAEDCFVATIAYGSADAWEVAVLRQFRDERLVCSRPGQFFIRAYYAWLSPTAVILLKAFGRPARTLARFLLNGLVRLVKDGAAPRERP